MNKTRDIYQEGKDRALRWYEPQFTDKCKGMHDGTTAERIDKAKRIREWVENLKIPQPSAHDLEAMGYNSGLRDLARPLDILIHALYKLQEIEKKT